MSSQATCCLPLTCLPVSRYSGSARRARLRGDDTATSEREPHTRRDPSEGCTATNTHMGSGRTGRPGRSASGRGLRAGHERQLGHRGSGAWRGAVAASGFRGVAGEGGGGAFQQGPDRCCGHAVQDHLVEGGSHAVCGGRQVPASQPGGLCPCWVRLMSASSTGNRAPMRPVAARRCATVMASPRCPGPRKRTRTRLDVPGRSRTGRPGSPVANPSLWASPARSPASPIGQSRQSLLGRGRS
jgi:hypothetical protein